MQVKRFKNMKDIDLFIQKNYLSKKQRVIMHLVPHKRPSGIQHVYFKFNEARPATRTSLTIYTCKLFLLDGKGWLTKEHSFAWQTMFQRSINAHPH